MTTLTIHAVGTDSQNSILDHLAVTGANVTVRMFDGSVHTGQLCDAFVHKDGEGVLYVETGVVAQSALDLRRVSSMHVNQE